MSSVINNMAAKTPSLNLTLNIMPSTEAYGIGDTAFKEKPLSPCNSLENLSDESAVSSFASCESFKTICQAWKNRVKSASNTSVDWGAEDLGAKLEDLTSKLDMSRTVSVDESRELAQRLSLCVMMESRSMKLTDSSEDDLPHGAGNLTQRFFQPEEIREAFATFKLCDGNSDNFIELPELKLALEKLSVPQTHLAAKQFMADVVGRQATQMNFCQFLLTYAAILQSNNGKSSQLTRSQLGLGASTESVNVSIVGVRGAKQFFESKIAEQVPEQSSTLSTEDLSCPIPNT